MSNSAEQNYFAEPRDDGFQDDPFLPEDFRRKYIKDILPDDVVMLSPCCLFSDGDNIFIDPEHDYHALQFIYEREEGEERLDGKHPTIVVARPCGGEEGLVAVTRAQFLDEDEPTDGYLIDIRKVSPGDIVVIDMDDDDFCDDDKEMIQRGIPVAGVVYDGDGERPEYRSWWCRDETIGAAQAMAETADTYFGLLNGTSIEPPVEEAAEVPEPPSDRASKKVMKALRGVARRALSKQHLISYNIGNE